jgi:hypothetical protein
MTITPVFETAPEGAVQLGLVSATATATATATASAAALAVAVKEPSASANLEMIDAQSDASAGSCCGGGCCS